MHMAANVTTVEKFKKLCELAVDDGASENEKRNAALKAIEILAAEEGELLVIPRAELEALQIKVEGAEKSLAKVKEARQSGMMMGGVLGFMLAKGGLGR